jgi:hypothetical protein
MKQRRRFLTDQRIIRTRALTQAKPVVGADIAQTMNETPTPQLIVSYHMDFIDQRADKTVFKDVLESDDVDEDQLIIERGGRERRVVEYTMECPECDGDGYYDQIGQVVCEDCGVVISGDEEPTLAVEYNADNSSGDGAAVGSSRGLEKMPGTRNSRGTHEPSI